MNMKYALRSEDTEQINVVSWAGWNMNRYPELKWLQSIDKKLDMLLAAQAATQAAKEE